jgi:hypothetical protein
VAIGRARETAPLITHKRPRDDPAYAIAIGVVPRDSTNLMQPLEPE